MNMMLLEIRISYGNMIRDKVRKLITSKTISLKEEVRMGDKRLVSEILKNDQFKVDFTKAISDHLKNHRDDYVSLRSDINENLPAEKRIFTSKESYRGAITNEISKLIAYEGLPINDVGRLIDDMLDNEKLEADIVKAILEHIQRNRKYYASLLN